MNVLVDYDNVRQQHRSRGLVYVADRMLQAISSVHPGLPARVRIRLYGGWYEGASPSHRAQDLASEILAEFPRMIPAAGVLVRTEVELAYSLEIEPSRHLWHTYRRYASTTDVACHSPATVGCSRMACALSSTYLFLSTGHCPEPGCLLEPRDVLFKRQQKLVDTMLTADLIHLAQSDPRSLCIVSSDDDLWPAVRTALLHGKAVIHVHTLPGRSTPRYYSAGAGSHYVQALF
jgi:hypothetical protein